MLDTAIVISEQPQLLVDQVVVLPQLVNSFELLEEAARDELKTLQHLNDLLREQATSFQTRALQWNAYADSVSHALARCQRSSLKLLRLVQKGAAD